MSSRTSVRCWGERWVLATSGGGHRAQTIVASLWPVLNMPIEPVPRRKSILWVTHRMQPVDNTSVKGNIHHIDSSHLHSCMYAGCG